MQGKYTRTPAEFWKHVQVNAGILVTGFNAATGAYTGILGATGGGVSFNPNPAFDDFGADVDNVPPNTKQLKRLNHYEPSLSGTFKTMTPALAAMLCPGGNASGVITPGQALTDGMFQNVTLLGDYSDVNRDATGVTAGMMAVTLKNALNVSGYQWKTTDDGKGEFPFDFRGHYDLQNPDAPPFDIYVKAPVT